MTLLNIWANSPLEQFHVSSLLTITGPLVADFVFAITNLGLYAMLLVGLVIGLHVAANNSHRLVPSHWSVMLETLYASIHSIVSDQLGTKHEVYVPFVYSLFWMLAAFNLGGNVPYAFAVTSSAVVAMGLSVTVFLAVTIIGLVEHRLHFFSYFVPAGTPLALVPMLVLIEFVSYLARAVSLGVRLAANVIAGHLLLSILASFLFGLFTSGLLIASVTLVPFAIFVALIVLELAVALIQAYVFTVLTCSYTHDAFELH